MQSTKLTVVTFPGFRSIEFVSSASLDTTKYLTLQQDVPIRLTLLESAPRILTAFPEAISASAASQLRGADIGGKIVTGSPCEVAEALDKSIGEMDGPVEYWETYRTEANVTYDVYRADVRGSEQVPVIQDGQDQEMIEAVYEIVIS
jgi:hypothetical protein